MDLNSLSFDILRQEILGRTKAALSSETMWDSTETNYGEGTDVKVIARS
jgi:hypothetical protein